MTYKLKFSLKLKWFDERLTFANLKDSHTSWNFVSNEEQVIGDD